MTSKFRKILRKVKKQYPQYSKKRQLKITGGIIQQQKKKSKK